MAKNQNLNSAARAKKDEFYTQIADIENELRHYQKFFAGKTVLCNCDDPYESDFFKYFTIYFNQLGLKKLIATCYAGSPIVQTELDFFGTPNENLHFDKKKSAIKFEVTEVKDLNGDGATDLLDVKLLLETNKNCVTYLDGDGDFRSRECIAALKEADVVVTNPPFSLFREYVAQLIEYDKKFLIIGNINCITYKEIFPLIMQNKIWLGYRMGRGISGFIVPETYELYGTEARIDERGRRIVSTNQCLWLTNIDIRKRHEFCCSGVIRPKLTRVTTITTRLKFQRPPISQKIFSASWACRLLSSTNTIPTNLKFWVALIFTVTRAVTSTAHHGAQRLTARIFTNGFLFGGGGVNDAEEQTQA